MIDELEDVHFEMAKQDRYGKRNNIEIGGIPVNIKKNLEETAIAILNKLDVDCRSKDIEGCHRLALSES